MILAKLQALGPPSTEPRWAIVEDGTAFALEGSRFANPVKGGKIGRLSEFRLLAPIEATNNVIGLFGTWTNLDGRDGPGIFIKPSTSRIDPEDAIVVPPIAGRVVFEAELGIVIGKPCRHVSAAEAPAFVLGYTIANDVTLFDIGVKTNFPIVMGKCFDTFGPIGPWIVTGLDGGSLRLSSRLNGTELVSANTGRMLWSPAQIVSWVSTVISLSPGDIISCGTPPGYEAMSPGDVIECEIEHIGVLRNRVALP